MFEPTLKKNLDHPEIERQTYLSKAPTILKYNLKPPQTNFH